MERTIAGWFAEGSSYLSNAWSGAGGKQEAGCSASSEADDAGSQKSRKDRSSTHDSAVSTTSSTSTRSSTSGSAKKLSKVMGWMVFGSRKVGRKGSSGSVVHDAPDCAPTLKKSALDILMAAGSTRPLQPVAPCELQAISVVGRGGYGKVILMKDLAGGRVVALKEVAKSNLVDKPKPAGSAAARSVRPVSTKIEHAEMERMVLGSAAEHPFITTFHGSFQNRDKIFLVTEYAPGGELFGLMQRQGVFAEARVQLYTAEIVSALEFLHGKCIIYRDLKPENILLDGGGHILITDFGLSIAFNNQGDDNLMRCHSICGTPEYISPEIVMGATTKKNDRSWSYGKTVDWWALGVLTYEMLYRLPPFFDRERKAMLEKIIECNLVFPAPNPKAPVVSQAANDFIAALLKFNETDRLGYGNEGSQRVKSHAFFSSLDWDRINAREYTPTFVPELKGDLDTSCFDPCFTKEFLREDKCSKCAYNLELTGYDYLPEDFSEAIWYKQAPATAVPRPLPNLAASQQPLSPAPGQVASDSSNSAIPVEAPLPAEGKTQDDEHKK